MGDKFWPVGEEKLEAHMGEFSAGGGMKTPSDMHRSWLLKEMVVSKADADKTVQGLTSRPRWHQTCATKHPGMCRDQNETDGISRAVADAVGGLHGIRSRRSRRAHTLKIFDT